MALKKQLHCGSSYFAAVLIMIEFAAKKLVFGFFSRGLHLLPQKDGHLGQNKKSARRRKSMDRRLPAGNRLRFLTGEQELMIKRNASL